MSDNPTTLQVYFYGALYPADDLPGRYLPVMMFITLTEPVWFVAGLGFVITAVKTVRKRIQWETLLPTLGWFAIPFVYVLIRQPPMYDGFRHFLFIIPPVFVLAGIALDSAFDWLKRPILQGALLLALLLPGILPGIYLHPYQYTYYNQFVGGTGEAAQRFETDYWLTCYKESVEQLIPIAEEKRIRLFVKREVSIAAYYAPKVIKVRMYKSRVVSRGHYVLLHSRANPGLQVLKDINPYFMRVERDGAIFCETQRY
jgi:hypothetical protein